MGSRIAVSTCFMELGKTIGIIKFCKLEDDPLNPADTPDSRPEGYDSAKLVRELSEALCGGFRASVNTWIRALWLRDKLRSRGSRSIACA